MMAFVGSSMAGNETATLNSETVSAIATSELTGCAAVYLDSYQGALDNGANNEQAAATAWVSYKSCLKNTNPIGGIVVKEITQ